MNKNKVFTKDYLLLDLSQISEVAQQTLLRTINLAMQAHYTDVEIRVDGGNVSLQADWIKYLREFGPEDIQTIKR